MGKTSYLAEVRFLLVAMCFAAVTAISSIYFLNNGFSSVWLLLCMLDLYLLIALLNKFKRQQNNLYSVLTALINGDSSMSLGQHHPMRELFQKLNQHLQTARFNAEQQAQFLQTVLIHVDIALLVCDSSGNVIESNPAVARLLHKQVQHINELTGLTDIINQCEQQSSQTVDWQHEEQQDTLSLNICCIEIRGKTYKIISLQSIRNALQNREQQAYKQLTKVLTHEVANSITPLVSLAHSCENLLPANLKFDSQEDKHDLQLGLTTLAKRTTHLGDFIDRFRTVSNLPAPQLSPQSISELVKRTYQLYTGMCADKEISLVLNIEQSPLIMLDNAQIEQVLINLLKNAIDALSSAQAHSINNTPQISITAAASESGSYNIDIIDNGSGIPAHVSEVMFVPFYTTKQNGSGIGLSLSKQIMQNHGGELIHLTTNQGAHFRCIFN